MSSLAQIGSEIEQIGTISKLSNVFSTIASMQIAKVKNQVLASKGFFDDLWRLYTRLRTEEDISQFTVQPTKEKELFIVITAEGGFSGDIDQKLIEWMLTQYDKDKADIIVIGHHGAVQLSQRGVSIEKYVKLPKDDENIEVTPIIKEVIKYPKTTAFYQTYVSLSVQDVKRLSLQAAVTNLSEEVEDDDDIIASQTYIFEPSDAEVIGYLESTMLGVALAQIILESKLAQYASRFKAMSAASDRAKETSSDLRLEFARAKRAISDERLKEIINSMRLAE